MASVDETPKVDAVAEIVEGFWRARVLAAAAQLGIPDAMGDERTTSEAIATRVEANPRGVFRLMRALASLGVCTHHGGSEFELTEAGRALRSDVPNSKYGHAAHIGNVVWGMFDGLDAMVRTGGSAIRDDAAGFEDLSMDADAMVAFHSSLARESRALGEELSDVFDFSPYPVVTDVGGGYGGLLQGLLESNPGMTGQVFDLPLLADDANQRFNAAGLSERAGFIGGDFFAEIPTGADAYVLKYILHDWDDEQCVRILQSCRKAAGANGAVLIVERPVPERVEAVASHADAVGFDLVMMSYGGMERTISEYADLMAQAGLTMDTVARAPSGFCVITGVAALSGPDAAVSDEREAGSGDRQSV